jgi:hypothetical protein
MNLGDGFIRRKQIASEIQNWTQRLSLAGRETLQYVTKEIEGVTKFTPIAGSTKEYKRTYMIEECQQHIDELIKEDLSLALRISITNQKASAIFIDLDGQEKTRTIPELLVLRNEIAPKMEQAARATPVQAKGVDIFETTSEFIHWRSVSPQYKHLQEMSDKGMKVENDVIEKYSIEEVKDFGWEERKIFDKVDEIHLWLQRIKNAINDANKTELIEL